MKKKGKINREKNLEDIWHQVPIDYYQRGVRDNYLQRLWHNGKLKTVFRLIDLSGKKPRKVLDVGCASGWFLSKIKERYPKAECTGIDVYKKAIDYGREIYKDLKLLSVDAHDLPFRESSFDLIICTEVLEHVENPEKVLSEIKRLLTPKGIAIIEMDSGNFLFRIIWYWWTNTRNGAWKDAHIHKFNTHILEEKINKSGFKISDKRVFNYTMGVVFCLSKIKLYI